jgi:hypothetical protein
LSLLHIELLCLSDFIDILTPEEFASKNPPIPALKQKWIAASSNNVQRNNSSCYICQSGGPK